MTGNVSRKEVRIITGAVHAGKSTELYRLIEEYMDRGMSVDGVVTEAEIEGGRKNAFYLRRVLGAGSGGRVGDVCSGEKVLLAWRVENGADTGGSRRLRTPGFVFDGEGFARARRWIASAVKRGVDVICIDELGPVELRGEGHWPSVEHVLDEFDGTFLAVVRQELSSAFAAKFRERGRKVLFHEVPGRRKER